MSATTSWSDLEGLTVKHAQNLERRSRAGVNRVAKANAVLKAAHHIFNPILRGLGSLLCNVIDAQTFKMADQAVWFLGLKGRIEKGALSKANETAIQTILEELERARNSVMELRSAALHLVGQFDRFNRHSKVARCFRRQLSTLTDLFDAIEAARWAVLECEADADMASEHFKSFSSLEQLLADLPS